MKVFILDKELEFNNDEQDIESIFDEIDQMILDMNCVFSHLDIDGVEVYENHYEYFLKHIEDIKEIKVITKTPNELAKDILLSTADYLERAIPQIEKLANEFYKTPEQESWAKLADLFEGFKWIIDTFLTLDGNYDIEKIVKSYETWNLYAQNIYALKELLGEFEELLSNQDLISIADILLYEIAPLFKKMIDKLNIIIDKQNSNKSNMIINKEAISHVIN